MAGWIKIYREIQDHWIWQDNKYFKWWATILLNVNHEEKKFPVGSELFVCNPGQSFRSIQQWTDLFSCSKPSTIKFFEMLKKDGMIQTEIVGNGNRRKHLLTVVNWGKYQEKETRNFTETVPEILPEINPNIPRNKNEEKEENENKEGVEEKPETVFPLSEIKESEKIDFKKLVEVYHSFCPKMPKVEKITEARKKAIRARIKEHGKVKVMEALKMAGDSKFLNGNNDRNWTADFDFVFTASKFVKILEGAYNQKDRTSKTQIDSPIADHPEWD